MTPPDELPDNVIGTVLTNFIRYPSGYVIGVAYWRCDCGKRATEFAGSERYPLCIVGCEACGQIANFDNPAWLGKR